MLKSMRGLGDLQILVLGLGVRGTMVLVVSRNPSIGLELCDC